VSGFGSAMSWLEGVIWAPSRTRGLLHALVGTSIGWAAGRVLVLVAGPVRRGSRSGRPSATATRRRSDPGAFVAGLVATWAVVAGRALGDAASAVGQALADEDLARARALLPALVGRDPENLDREAIARAVIESVAENTVDAVVAPVFWSVVSGPPGAFAYRAVNTMDAMVGHRSARYERYGWAAARLDDLANWLPARMSAVLVAAVAPGSAPEVWRAVRHDAGAHPSPNAGVAEAAFAGALGLRLGGVNSYRGRVEQRGVLGHGRSPEPADIQAAVELARRVSLLLSGLLVAPTVFGWLRR
jgi:adenosylcobinamide-phosphate synthase